MVRRPASHAIQTATGPGPGIGRHVPDRRRDSRAGSRPYPDWACRRSAALRPCRLVYARGHGCRAGLRRLFAAHCWPPPCCQRPPRPRWPACPSPAVTVILAGLLPLLVGGGTGSEAMRRIVAPLIGGMVTATLLLLFMLPAVYWLWQKRRLVGGAGGSRVRPGAHLEVAWITAPGRFPEFRLPCPLPIGVMVTRAAIRQGGVGRRWPSGRSQVQAGPGVRTRQHGDTCRASADGLRLPIRGLDRLNASQNSHIKG